MKTRRYRGDLLLVHPIVLRLLCSNISCRFYSDLKPGSDYCVPFFNLTSVRICDGRGCFAFRDNRTTNSMTTGARVVCENSRGTCIGVVQLDTITCTTVANEYRFKRINHVRDRPTYVSICDCSFAIVCGLALSLMGGEGTAAISQGRTREGQPFV